MIQQGKRAVEGEEDYKVNIMKIKILNRTNEEIKFVVDGISVPFANALRRIMMVEVPTLAIEDVYFRENDSVMFDEVIAHRLGLIPLKFNPETLNFREDCSCEGEGCPNCQVVFELEKEGPCMVYSKDLKSSSEEVHPLYDNIPIVKLEKGQRLSLEAIAILGRGKDHIKWKAAIASYKYYPIIKINSKKCDNCGKCIKACPKNVLALDKDKVVIQNIEECSLCKACVEACGDKEAIEVTGDENKFIFTVESVSGLSPMDIVLKSCEILEEKSNELLKLL